jgi:hypothetical protein
LLANATIDGRAVEIAIVGDRYTDLLVRRQYRMDLSQRRWGSETVVIPHQNAVPTRGQSDCAPQVSIIPGILFLDIICVSKPEAVQGGLELFPPTVG